MTTNDDPFGPVGERPELSPLEECLRRAEAGAGPGLSADSATGPAAADAPPLSPGGGGAGGEELRALTPPAGAGHVDTTHPVSVAGPPTTPVISGADEQCAEIERLKTKDQESAATITRLSAENKARTDVLREIYDLAGQQLGRREHPAARRPSGPPTAGLLSGLAKAFLTQRGGGR